MTALGGKWAGHYTTGEMDICIVLSIVMLSIIGVCVCCFLTGVYRLLPGWGPIRKFDNDAGEDVRIRQYLIHEHIEGTRLSGKIGGQGAGGYGAPGQGAGANAGKGERFRSTIGRPTWGVLEAPYTEVPVEYPGLEGTFVREGFADTIKLREQSDWWGRDEPHYIMKEGLHQAPLRVNEAHVTCPRRMV
mmetsp:Transcript_75927/g.210795  ORF Transcript_75927/g.210795 Transcript_75927/m.210795 type:complete len:189 (+) Transcript_75927:194-760(+)